MTRFVHERANSTNRKGRPPSTVRRDASGRIDPYHEVRLRLIAQLGHNPDGDPISSHAFIAGRRSGEQLSEELAEAFLQSVTSGENIEFERPDRVSLTEELEPYVLTLAEGSLDLDGDGTELSRRSMTGRRTSR